MTKPHKPGETVPQSGLYKVIDPNNKPTGERVTSVKGEPFPPTPKAGGGYQIDVVTN